MIYLDNNATTRIDPRVVDAMTRVHAAGPANASSLHRFGRESNRRLTEAADRIADVLHSRVDRPGGPRLIWTSGGTESNHLAVTGIRRDEPLAVSAIEHPCVLEAAGSEAARGRPVHYLAVDRRGVVDLHALGERLRADDRPGVVALMSANNETGVLQPVETAASLCAGAGVHLHVDATQTVGKLEFAPERWGIGSAAFAAHKFHGPAGVGGLWVRGGVEIDPVMRGGQQQLGTRPGTEPVALIVGMAEALSLSRDGRDDAAIRMAAMRDRIESDLMAAGDVVVHGGDADRLPHTTCLSPRGVDRQTLLMALDFAGVAVGSGSACGSGSMPPSHVLRAMGAGDESLKSAFRVGVSRMTTDEELNSAIGLILRCIGRLRS